MRGSERGQATLIFVTVVCGLATFFIMNSTSIFQRNYDQKTRDFDRVLLNEVTTSTFAIMESALARRLWEPPPDDRCMKSEEFSVKGKMSDGMEWSVSTRYNPVTKNYEMTARGSYHDLNATFIKRVKVLDVSDYLLFSDSENAVALSRTFNEKLPTTLIARDRRLYVRGPVVMRSVLARPNSNSNFLGSPANWPGDFGTIIQGDRIQFTGGIFYSSTSIPEPNVDQSPPTAIRSLLAPYSEHWGDPPRFLAQESSGVGLVTRDYGLATDLSEQVLTGATGPRTKAEVRQSVYPVALFSGSLPLESWKASDSGSYMNDPDRSSIFTYSYGLDNKFGHRLDAACISPADAFATRRYCSHSEHFPRGFARWRKDAGLEGIFFTADSEVIPSPRMNWDNFQALEEDAQRCGLVVDAAGADSYEDCPVWDPKFMTEYAGSGSPRCPRIAVVDMDNVALNDFDVAALSDPSMRDRIQRRVIYLKTRTELRQTSARGIFSSITDPIARKNLPIWVVSEDVLALRGYQQDTTSPLTTDPGRLREVVFNEDATSTVPGARLEPVSMVLLSPEKVHLLSPFYVPASSSYLQTYWPSAGGKIHPVIHNYTDYVRQEDDGFKYGFRNYRIGNMSLIGNAKGDASQPFYLRGLWSGPDSTADQLIADQCMASVPGRLPVQSGTSYLIDTAVVPTSGLPSPSPIPDPSSKYYNHKTSFPLRYYPDVFWVQTANGHVGRQESGLIFHGTRIYATFDSAAPSGKRDLSTPLYPGSESRSHSVPTDLSARTFAYDTTYYYKNRSPGTSCVPENVEFRSPSPYDVAAAVKPTMNNGRYTLIHREPPVDYRGVGAIVGVDQPVLETRVRSGGDDAP